VSADGRTTGAAAESTPDAAGLSTAAQLASCEPLCCKRRTPAESSDRFCVSAYLSHLGSHSTAIDDHECPSLLGIFFTIRLETPKASYHPDYCFSALTLNQSLCLRHGRARRRCRGPHQPMSGSRRRAVSPGQLMCDPTHYPCVAPDEIRKISPDVWRPIVAECWSR
jgi:hypothetical protein